VPLLQFALRSLRATNDLYRATPSPSVSFGPVRYSGLEGEDMLNWVKSYLDGVQ